MVCGVVGRGASSLTSALGFQVTDIHALAPGLWSDSEVNTSHLFLPPAPLQSFSSESAFVLPRLFWKLVTARTRDLGNHRWELWAGRGHWIEFSFSGPHDWQR